MTRRLTLFCWNRKHYLLFHTWLHIIPAAFIITSATIFSDLEIQLQTIQKSRAPKCNTHLESFALALKRCPGMFAFLEGWQEIGSLGLAKLWNVLAWQRSPCWCKERFVLPPDLGSQSGHNTCSIQDAPWQIPYLRVCLRQRNAMLLEQTQSTKSTEKNGTRRTSCLLCAGKRK